MGTALVKNAPKVSCCISKISSFKNVFILKLGQNHDFFICLTALSSFEKIGRLVTLDIQLIL
jgi:hypothetical protein